MNNSTQKIDDYLAGLPDWQAENLTTFRKLVHLVDPGVTEDWKWNVPVFNIDGKLTFAMSAFKAHTKYNFIGNGALLEDPNHLFNNGFDSKKSRGIDLREGESIDKAQLKLLIEEAMQLGRK